jgi:hypothetical protein
MRLLPPAAAHPQGLPHFNALQKFNIVYRCGVLIDKRHACIDYRHGRGSTRLTGPTIMLHRTMRRKTEMSWYRVSSAMDRYLTNALLGALMAGIPASVFVLISHSI